MPGWHPADEPPDPATLEGELVLVPSVEPPADAERLVRPVAGHGAAQSAAGRSGRVASTKRSRPCSRAAAIDPDQVDANHRPPIFSRSGYAHLQVELLTRAMRYTTVLDTEHFERGGRGGQAPRSLATTNTAREELARAFDLLADARNHVYSVDFYVVDVTLLAGFDAGRIAAGEAGGRIARRVCWSPASKSNTWPASIRKRWPNCGERSKRARPAIVGGMYAARGSTGGPIARSAAGRIEPRPAKRPSGIWVASTKCSASSTRHSRRCCPQS